MTRTDLDAVAAALGVVTSYLDVDGVERHADPRTVGAVCDLLSGAAPATQARPAVDEVVVVRGGRVVSGLASGLVRGVRDGRAMQVVPLLEDGTELRARAVAAGRRDLADVPVGIHRVLSRDARGDERVSTLLAAPDRFGRPPHERPGRALFTPAYALWGGDEPLPSYDGLAQLGATVAHLGVDTIATLPLYAPGSGDRFESSPYSPLSRFHFNELLVPSRLLGGPLADRDVAMPADRVRWDVLETTRWAQLARCLEGLDEAGNTELDRYLEQRPDVVSYAAYAAAGGGTARLHELGQLLAERALTELLAGLDGLGQRLALDLPVGARMDSWETATWPHLFCREASIGAPPDTFFAAGQRWGLPPLIPTASRRDGHRVWRDLLATACRYARVVRIDHVMQVHRLWWIPEGNAADDGVYVRYPTDELLAVAAIVAEQTGTTMVGENLGTVPPPVSAAMNDWGLVGMHEEVDALHAFADDAPPVRLPAVPAGTWAGIRTHDMPALAATWAAVPTEGYRRALEVAVGHPVADEPVEVAAAMVERLAASDADDVVVDLDDALGVTAPHNVPGVVGDQNWTRRIAVPVAALADEPSVARVLTAGEDG